MHEPLAADVHPDVRKGFVAGIEEDEVAGAQLGRFDRAPLAGDVGGAAAQAHSRGPLVDVRDHAAAIEPCIRVLAAETVTGVEQAEGKDRDFAARLGLRRLPDDRRRRAIRRRGRRCRARGQPGEQRQQREDGAQGSKLHAQEYKLSPSPAP